MVAFSSIIFIWSIFSVAYVKSTVRRAIGGRLTTIENFSYQISLQMNGKSWCGGGIIGTHWILTAAHCIVDDKGKLRSYRFSVIAGTTDLRNSTEDLSVKVEQVYIPRSYRPLYSANDIAILKLEKDLNSSLSILKLPQIGQSYVGQVAKIAGYGWNRLQNWTHGGSDDMLRYLNVTIISNDECRWQFRKFVNITKQRIHDSNICGKALPQHAGDPTGVCKGDSGSPLVIGNTVIGIANRAGSRNCTEDELAARYTRVSNFLVFVVNVFLGYVTKTIKLLNLTPDAEVLDIIYDPEDK